MANKQQLWDDTIVALATAPGIGAISVIRLSGKDTIAVVNSLFPSKDLAAQASHTLHVGFLKQNNELLDEVVIALFKGPTSYTGEDVIEISCHGSNFIVEKIIKAICNTGVRIAKPGEFTQRAFLNGKMDLTQAESVADLIASNTEASRKTALNNMRGGFSTALHQLREELIKFSALIELELDFSQEDVAFADRKQLYQLIGNLAKSTNELLQSFQLGNVIKNGVQVAIIGKPNAGKSTLLNSLLNENRAIVSEIAGTTRDTVEEILNIEGVLFRLIDTAGIREHSKDTIETIGIEKSFEKMRAADIVLYLFDVNDMDTPTLETTVAGLKHEKIQYLLIGNKVDGVEEKVAEKFAVFPETIFISAKQNKQINELKKSLVAKAISGDILADATIVTNARHFDALKQLSNSLKDVLQGLDNDIPSDLIAMDIRQCLHYLGLITGEITNEDQLDFIFSKFCIGK